MTFRCDHLDRALASEDPALVDAARRHAASCPACRDELQIWDDISDAARTMRRRWESPTLWPRIQAGLVAAGAARGRTRARWAASAAAAVLVLASASAWWAWRGPAAPPVQTESRLLGDRALEDVERAETDYMRAIDRLSALAAPRIDAPSAPLMLALREKLLLIDSAIAQCRVEIDRNRFNTHLRRELLAMYREKRQTLEEIINAPNTAS